MYGIDHDHDYLQEKQSEMFLKSINVTEISSEAVASVCANTVGQSQNFMWLEERTKRLHSSSFGRICKMTERTDKEKLAVQLTLVNKLNTPAVKHGRKYESVALRQFETITGKSVRSCGIYVCESAPFLGCSPDGILDGATLIEVKCPYVARDNKISPQTVPYVKQADDSFELDHKHDYYYQIQGQLMCT